MPASEPRACEKSGLVFTPKTKAQKNHPEIMAIMREFDRHRDECLEAIAEGKKQGLQTVEEFRELVLKYVYPPQVAEPEPELPVPVCDGIAIVDVRRKKVDRNLGKSGVMDKLFCARIVGTSAAYGWERSFIESAGVVGRTARFFLSDGLYEIGRADEGNGYYLVESGSARTISFDEARAIVPYGDTKAYARAMRRCEELDLVDEDVEIHEQSSRDLSVAERNRELG